MQVQTGIDIIEVHRIQEAIEKQGEKFLNHIYTKNEIEYCEHTNKMKYQHYAARFAAKEAIFKAISNKIQNETGKNGRPIANLERLNLEKIESMDLSLSHLKEYAVASFIITFKDE